MECQGQTYFKLCTDWPGQAWLIPRQVFGLLDWLLGQCHSFPKWVVSTNKIISCNDMVSRWLNTSYPRGWMLTASAWGWRNITNVKHLQRHSGTIFGGFFEWFEMFGHKIWTFYIFVCRLFCYIFFNFYNNPIIFYKFFANSSVQIVMIERTMQMSSGNLFLKKLSSKTRKIWTSNCHLIGVAGDWNCSSEFKFRPPSWIDFWLQIFVLVFSRNRSRLARWRRFVLQTKLIDISKDAQAMLIPRGPGHPMRPWLSHEALVVPWGPGCPIMT